MHAPLPHLHGAHPPGHCLGFCRCLRGAQRRSLCSSHGIRDTCGTLHQRLSDLILGSYSTPLLPRLLMAHSPLLLLPWLLLPRPLCFGWFPGWVRLIWAVHLTCPCPCRETLGDATVLLGQGRYCGHLLAHVRRGDGGRCGRGLGDAWDGRGRVGDARVRWGHVGRGGNAGWSVGDGARRRLWRSGREIRHAGRGTRDAWAWHGALASARRIQWPRQPWVDSSCLIAGDGRRARLSSARKGRHRPREAKPSGLR